MRWRGVELVRSKDGGNVLVRRVRDGVELS